MATERKSVIVYQIVPVYARHSNKYHLKLLSAAGHITANSVCFDERGRVGEYHARVRAAECAFTPAAAIQAYKDITDARKVKLRHELAEIEQHREELAIIEAGLPPERHDNNESE